MRNPCRKGPLTWSDHASGNVTENLTGAHRPKPDLPGMLFRPVNPESEG